jgi:hypothetical protein
MNFKTLTGVIAAGCIFSSAAFGQTVQITGTVTAVTDTQITLKSGPDTWTIKRDSTTKVTTGNLSVGSAVTVLCLSIDAHKNEGPSTGG